MLAQPDMPPDVLAAFELYLDGARRNVSETARLRGIPRPTAQRWSERYRWRDRAADIDRDQTDAAIADARARHARRLGEADAAIGLALRARIGADGTPYSTDDAGQRVDAPVPMGVRAALAVYANHGIRPPQHVALDVRHSAPSLGVSAAELGAMDTASLLALLSGQGTPALPPPGDFASGHPGGRGASEPPPPEADASEFPGPVLEAEFGHPASANGRDGA